MKFSKVRRSGERVIIDGRCFSACTIVTALVPRTRICITPRAVLGFHAAAAPAANGQLTVDPNATRMMYDLYPKFIRARLAADGGLGRRIIILHAQDLAAYYPWCKSRPTQLDAFGLKIPFWHSHQIPRVNRNRW